jgi:hypothetical protein
MQSSTTAAQQQPPQESISINENNNAGTCCTTPLKQCNAQTAAAGLPFQKTAPAGDSQW